MEDANLVLKTVL